MLILTHVTLAQNNIEIHNESYAISVPEIISDSTKISINRIGVNETIEKKIAPNFTVFYASEDPAFQQGFIKEGNSPVSAWGERNQINFWGQGEPVMVMAKAAQSIDESTILLSFDESDFFDINATLHLPEGTKPPEITWNLSPKVDGWFSVAFTGIAPQAPEKLDFLYQPLIWSWKRFPADAVLTPEAFATTAATFTNFEGATEGLAVHPKNIPYRFASFDNSLFGVALRTQDNLAKPVIVAPILGGNASKMKVGQNHAFIIRYFIQPGNWLTGADYLYKNVLNYENERQNATVSLNQTLQNMINFAMDDVYGGWVEALKGNDYRFDVPGTVKNVSALHPLSLALTTGDEKIYRRRALPMIEYMMSRQKYLYATSDTIVAQNPSHFLEGPTMEIAELASLYQMTARQNEAFLAETQRVFGKPRQLNLKTGTGGESWQDYLARYLLEGDTTFLRISIDKAKGYLQNTFLHYPTNFSTNAGLQDTQATFTTDYSNRWQDLLELYEATLDTTFLEAAFQGAKQHLLWTRSNPMAPDTLISVNRGGNVPGVFPGRRYKANSYEWKEFDTSTDIPEQRVPAWRTSLIGLPPETPYTYFYGPIMLNHQAAPLLRLAHLKGDRLMRDVAYNGIIGRYANFPGYYFTSLYTTVYQQPDYPLNEYFDIKYNAIFYNHIWPHIALMQDFLVSDAYYRSCGRIDFPSAYAPGYAFLASKVYGHKPGKIYDNENVHLWLPSDAVKSSDIELNHIFGRDKENTYLVLMNTAPEAVSTQIFLNPDIIKWDYDKEYQTLIYQADGKTSNGSLRNGNLHVDVPPLGLATIKIIGLVNSVSLQEVVAPHSPDFDEKSYFRETYAHKKLGTLTGMLIGLVPDYVDAYIYTNATEKDIETATLHYQIGEGNWQEIVDDSYPYEFSLRNSSPGEGVRLRLETLDLDDNVHHSKEYTLKR